MPEQFDEMPRPQPEATEVIGRRRFVNLSRSASSDKKGRIVIWLFVYSVVLGAIVCFLPADDKVMEIVFSLPIWFLIISWCLADAKERGQQLGRLTIITLVLFFVVAFPIYLLRTRGIQGFVAIFWTLLIAAGMSACVIASGLLVNSLGDAVGLWDALR